MQKFVAQSQKSVLKSSLRGFAVWIKERTKYIWVDWFAKEMRSSAVRLWSKGWNWDNRGSLMFNCSDKVQSAIPVLQHLKGHGRGRQHELRRAHGWKVNSIHTLFVLIFENRRDVLVESARISRANCQDLKDINVEDYDVRQYLY